MSVPTISRRSLGLGVLGAALLGGPLAAAALAPDWTAVVAGSLLLACGFLVMAPCELQMAATIATIARRGGAVSAGELRRTSVRFSLGYLGFYVPVAVVIGVTAVAIGRAAWVFLLCGAAISLVLGGAILGHARPRWLAECRGPLWLLRSGRASFRSPFRAGVAFGQFCITCCGPYIFALVFLAGTAQSFWLGSGLVVLYALSMIVPFLGPVLVAPETWGALSDRLASAAPAVERATAAGLLAVAASTAYVGLTLALA